MQRKNKKRLLVGLSLLSTISLSACFTIQPKPLSNAEIKSQAKLDQQSAYQQSEKISGTLTVEEAVARALKYNLERRVRMLEEAMSLNQLELGKFDMLPKLLASAGYSNNSEYRITRAEDSITGKPSLANPFVSSDKQHTVTELGLSWNILDFGLSYYNAQQDADRVLIAQERRRKAMHLLIQDVRTAYWRAISAQQLRAQVKASIRSADEALLDAKKAEEERLRSPLDSLRYQRQLLENLRLLESIDQELATARIELAHLINVPLNGEFTVVEPTAPLSRSILELPVQELEDIALGQNADLREQFYNAQISSQEVRKAMLRIFPNLNFSTSFKHDDDRFLIHQNWREASAQISYNFLGLLSMPARKKFAEAGVQLADQRRIATQMAVLTQVNIAAMQYSNAIQQFNRADAIWSVESKINAHISNSAQAQKQSRLDEVASNTSMILSQLRRYQSLAMAHSAAGKLQASLGLEPEIASVQDLGLEALTEVVRQSFLRWDAGQVGLRMEKSLPVK